MKRSRIESIDLLRGIVMVIMALDHVRDFFHRDAFFYDPTDLSQTSVVLFFTRFITHYCAAVFVFLAGMSSYLYGVKRTKADLVYYLFTRGLWLIFAELFIISLEITFNPTYPLFKLQVIWAIGFCMIGMSALIWLPRRWIGLIAIILIAAHNLLDTVHVSGSGLTAFLWSFLHEQKYYRIEGFTVFIQYPVLPWIGIMAMGYFLGSLYKPGYEPEKRKKILRLLGFSAIGIFLVLRSFNIYGDALHWAVQKNFAFSLLSLLNVSKYPPSLLYILITLGPALIFLSLSERPLNSLTRKLSVFGRVPFFYYILHLFFIHLLAVAGVVFLGYPWTSMILSDRVNAVPALKGYGFNLLTVYIIWAGLVIFLYPFCKWFDRIKKTHQADKPWLTFL